MSRGILRPVSLVIVLLGVLIFSAGCNVSFGFLGSKDRFEVTVASMTRQREEINKVSSQFSTPNPDYTSFLEHSQNFLQDIPRLREAVTQRQLDQSIFLLDNVYSQYRSMSDSADKIGDEKVRLFMGEARASLQILVGEIRGMTQEIRESRSVLEAEKGSKAALHQSLDDTSRELGRSCTDLEQKLVLLESDKRDEISYAVARLALLAELAFFAGFAVLIPWFKKFADEEEYWGFSVKRTGRMSPVRILMFMSIFALVVLVGYVLFQGYVKALL